MSGGIAPCILTSQDGGEWSASYSGLFKFGNGAPGTIWVSQSVCAWWRREKLPASSRNRTHSKCNRVSLNVCCQLLVHYTVIVLGMRIRLRMFMSCNMKYLWIITVQLRFLHCIRGCTQKVSGLAAWSENCKWYSSLPLGTVLSLFC